MSGAVVWVIGLPSSGKSTLAGRIATRLRAAGLQSALLDGDQIRAALDPRPGYDWQARSRFYGTLARLAALLANQGLVAVVAATASRRAFRERARALAPRFVEVFVDVPLEVCAARDTKGLYAAARRGAAPDLPGVGSGFERPEHPDVVASGGEDLAAPTAVLALLTGSGSYSSTPAPTDRP
jgi:adenylylsulfate kinase